MILADTLSAAVGTERVLPAPPRKVFAAFA
jgi:uncharacterized protein YndB with AHSA1/START domain